MKKILFVEDEHALQKTIGDALSKKGYQVISAVDGETGLRMVSSEKPDLVLLDLILPRMLGLEVLKRLKDNSETKDVPVIVLTNLDDMDKINRAIELGAAAYLLKSSYKLEDVLEKIHKFIGKEN